MLIRPLTLYGLRASTTPWPAIGDLVDAAHDTQPRVRGKSDHVDLDQDTSDARPYG
ncbi:hypothetical protein [Nocardiopsis sp. FIRDI 009]|uniref:hypothetical protein n=1 Tax=Nocardiopsis sp. FIRDI 009 TaxID=714197 RepID=UPI001300308E|nr:hypothetical protein [Nocardiopsis sp. FIRDI 009]